MRAQYLAERRLSVNGFEALESHNRRLEIDTYQFHAKPFILDVREPQVTLILKPGRTRHIAVWRPIVSNRRRKCPRASNLLQCSVWLLPLQLAPNKKKNTWLSTPSRSRLSQYTQVSTSKRLPEQALAPAPYYKVVQALASALYRTETQASAFVSYATRLTSTLNMEGV